MEGTQIMGVSVPRETGEAKGIEGVLARVKKTSVNCDFRKRPTIPRRNTIVLFSVMDWNFIPRVLQCFFGHTQKKY